MAGSQSAPLDARYLLGVVLATFTTMLFTLLGVRSFIAAPDQTLALRPSAGTMRRTHMDHTIVLSRV